MKSFHYNTDFAKFCLILLNFKFIGLVIGWYNFVGNIILVIGAFIGVVLLSIINCDALADALADADDNFTQEGCAIVRGGNLFANVYRIKSKFNNYSIV